MRARRPLVLLLCTLALSALSCRAPHGAPAAARAEVPARAEGPRPEPQLALVRSFLAMRPTGLTPDEIEGLARAVVREARAQDLRPELILAVIHVESGGYNFARSHVGALGLMQLLPDTGEALARELGAPWRGPSSLFDPELNVQLGASYLRRLLDRYGDLRTALAAYNWGPTRISTRLREGRGLPVEYVQRVFAVLSPPASRAI